MRWLQRGNPLKMKRSSVTSSSGLTQSTTRCSTILARGGDITLGEVYTQLLTFEQRVNLQSGGSQTSANIASRGGRGSGRGNNNRGGRGGGGRSRGSNNNRCRDNYNRSGFKTTMEATEAKAR